MGGGQSTRRSLAEEGGALIPACEARGQAAPLAEGAWSPASVIYASPELAGAVRAADPGCETHVYDASGDREFETLATLISVDLIGRAVDAAANPGQGRPAAYLEAPVTAINRVLEANPSVREFVEQGWLNLYALYDDGAVIVRYEGDLHWAPATVQDVA